MSPKLILNILHQTDNHFRSPVFKLPGNVIITSSLPLYFPKTWEEEDPAEFFGTKGATLELGTLVPVRLPTGRFFPTKKVPPGAPPVIKDGKSKLFMVLLEDWDPLQVIMYFLNRW